MSAAARMELPDFLCGKVCFSWLWENFPFSEQKEHSFHFFSTEFPFSEHRILGSLFRAPLQFQAQNLHLLRTEFRFSSAQVAFSEHRILGGLLRVVFERRISNYEHRISIFLAWNLHFPRAEFPFWDRGILEGSTTEYFLLSIIKFDLGV